MWPDTFARCKRGRMRLMCLYVTNNQISSSRPTFLLHSKDFWGCPRPRFPYEMRHPQVHPYLFHIPKTVGQTPEIPHQLVRGGWSFKLSSPDKNSHLKENYTWTVFTCMYYIGLLCIKGQPIIALVKYRIWYSAVFCKSVVFLCSLQ